MGKRTSAEEVARVLKAALVTDSHVERGAAFKLLRKRLPPGVPHELVTRFWAEQMRFPVIYHRLSVTPDSYLAAVVAGLRASKSPAATFLVRAAGSRPTAEALRAANRAFHVLSNSPSPYTPKARGDLAPFVPGCCSERRLEARVAG